MQYSVVPITRQGVNFGIPETARVTSSSQFHENAAA